MFVVRPHTFLVIHLVKKKEEGKKRKITDILVSATDRQT